MHFHQVLYSSRDSIVMVGVVWLMQSICLRNFKLICCWGLWLLLFWTQIISPVNFDPWIFFIFFYVILQGDFTLRKRNTVCALWNFFFYLLKSWKWPFIHPYMDDWMSCIHLTGCTEPSLGVALHGAINTLLFDTHWETPQHLIWKLENLIRYILRLVCTGFQSFIYFF